MKNLFAALLLASAAVAPATAQNIFPPDSM